MNISDTITKEEFYKDNTLTWVYISLRLICNNTPSTTMKGTYLKEGQCVIGLVDFSNKIGVSTSVLRTSLSKLINCGAIETKGLIKLGTVVTILGFEQEEVKPKVKKKAPVKKLKSVDERIIDFKRECNKYFEKYNKDVKFFEQFVAHWTAKKR